MKATVNASAAIWAILSLADVALNLSHLGVTQGNLNTNHLPDSKPIWIFRTTLATILPYWLRLIPSGWLPPAFQRHVSHFCFSTNQCWPKPTPDPRFSRGFSPTFTFRKTDKKNCSLFTSFSLGVFWGVPF